jgi:hypothetical protein
MKVFHCETFMAFFSISSGGQAMAADNSKVKELESRVENIALLLEKAKIAEYVNIMTKPKTLLLNNFIGGVARGFGTAIGFTILGAVVLYLMRQAVLLNLPFIGGFIAEIVKIVQDHLL